KTAAASTLPGSRAISAKNTTSSSTRATAKLKAKPSVSRTWATKLKRPSWNCSRLSTTFSRNHERYPFLHREHIANAAAQNRAEKRRPDFVKDRKRESDREHERPDGTGHDQRGGERWAIGA